MREKNSLYNEYREKLIFNLQHLLRQIFVGIGHLALRVMGVNAFPLCADLFCPDRVGDFRSKDFDLGTVVLPQQSGDFFGKILSGNLPWLGESRLFSAWG